MSDTYRRTEDNLFILDILYNSYVIKQKKKVYIDFVDFTKFFDIMNQDFLYYKLLKYGLSGYVYKMIENIYSTTNYRV